MVRKSLVDAIRLMQCATLGPSLDPELFPKKVGGNRWLKSLLCRVSPDYQQKYEYSVDITEDIAILIAARIKARRDLTLQKEELEKIRTKIDDLAEQYQPLPDVSKMAEIIEQALSKGDLTDQEIRVFESFEEAPKNLQAHLENQAQNTTAAVLSETFDNGNIHATAARVSSERTP